MTHRSPRIAHWLAARMLPAAHREFLLGDLEEVFVARCDENPTAARRWYWSQTLRALGERLRSAPDTNPATSPPPRGDRPMQTLLFDLRLALRSLRRSPGFALVASFTLALGLGMTSAMFSVVDTVLLSPLPYDEPDRLVSLWGCDRTTGAGSWSSSYPDFEDLRDGSASFTDLAAAQRHPVNLSGGAEPLRVIGSGISHRLFPMLGIEPALGRSFLPVEDQRGAAPVVILSHGLWTSYYGADQEILGKTVHIDGVEHTVVGVLPAGREYPPQARLWRPLEPLEGTEIRGIHNLLVVGRLQPGVGLDAATADVEAVAQRLSDLYPGENAQRGARLEPLIDAVVGHVRPYLLTLFVAVGCVLLIACANVSGLLLSRATARSREVATRSALGAGRLQLLRQFLCESLLLSAVGSLLGLFLARWALLLLPHLGATTLPRLAHVELDGRVFGFTLLILVLTSTLFALAPTVEVLRPGLFSALRQGGQSTTGLRRQRLRRGLVVAEVALAAVLVVGAALLIESFRRLAAVDPGFQQDGLLAVDLELPKPFISEDWPQTVSFFEELNERLEALPGIDSAAAAYNHPASGGWSSSFTLDDRPPPEEGFEPEANFRPVTHDYFETAGIPLITGRLFDRRDNAEAPGVVLVNEAFVRAHFPNGDALGKSVQRPSWWQSERSAFEIVGIVGDVHFHSHALPAAPAMYFVHTQQPTPQMTLVLRTQGDPLAHADAIRKTIWSMNTDLPVGQVATVSELLQDSVATSRFILRLLGIFAGAALFLAALGIYGLLAYSVTRRQREIGLRMAMGAERGDVLRQVLHQGLRLTLAGLAVGLVAALALGKVMGSILYGVEPSDPATFATVVAVLSAVAVVASLLPALRATRVDPLVALHHE